MPHTPPASPRVGRQTEEEKSLNSSQDSSFDENSFDESSFDESGFDERVEENSELSADENSEFSEDEDNEQTSEESSQHTSESTEETQSPQNNAQRRNANTLFGFAPRAPQVYVCEHGHVHLMDFINENTMVFITLNAGPDLMRLMALASLLEALGLGEENDLEENVGQQTEQKQEEEPIKLSEGKGQLEDEESEEENNEEYGYSHFKM
ncbi:hypothetical protein [Fluoribacter gormanii]|uniref:hypothetical protein n=1 Tax=Fluoribacter gormanii TaxID=464 RepID=UPI001040E9AA|nr:hypothetical protein [Fluoribacter gormanii]